MRRAHSKVLTESVIEYKTQCAIVSHATYRIMLEKDFLHTGIVINVADKSASIKTSAEHDRQCEKENCTRHSERNSSKIAYLIEFDTNLRIVVSRLHRLNSHTAVASTSSDPASQCQP